jgi:hypothetical protein
VVGETLVLEASWLICTIPAMPLNSTIRYMPLLGMCSDNLSAAGLESDYSTNSTTVIYLRNLRIFSKS